MTGQPVPLAAHHSVRARNRGGDVGILAVNDLNEASLMTLAALDDVYRPRSIYVLTSDIEVVAETFTLVRNQERAALVKAAQDILAEPNPKAVPKALPVRRLTGAFVSKLTVLADDADGSIDGISATTMAFEMFGEDVVVLRGQRATIDDEDLETAAVWITGGPEKPVIEERQEQILISPGNAGAEGGFVLAEGSGRDLSISVFNTSCVQVSTHKHRLARATRMSVQG